MLACALVLTALSVAPQDTATLDVPVYENPGYGVSLPRPFDDWVFSPGAGRLTMTVIFHPRGGLLREQFWGALILTPYPGTAPLGSVADERVAASWRPTLGSSFRLLARDSLAVVGQPAIHIVMSGAISRVALDVEEYLIARGADLIVLQFRYPRGLPRDSIALGYQRAFDGLLIRDAAPAPGAAAATTAAARREAERAALALSPWQVRAYDAAVRFDSSATGLQFAVRMDLVNDGAAPRDSVVLALAPALALDSVRSAVGRRLPLAPELAVKVGLPATVEPQGTAALVIFYRLTPLGGEQRGEAQAYASVSSEEAHLLLDWMPRVQPWTDSAGHPVRALRPRHTFRFDVPEPFRAVAPGRLTSDLVALGRRRMTWVADDVGVGLPGFAIGRYRVVPRRAGSLTVNLWLPESGGRAGEDVYDSLLALVRQGWAFYSLAFGRLPIGQLQLVAVESAEPRGLAGMLLVGRGAASPSRDAILRELARTWWGNSVTCVGPGAGWVLEGFPAWAAIAARGVLEGDSVRQRLVREAEGAWRTAVAAAPDAPLTSDLISAGGPPDLLRTKGAAALEAVRRAVGDATFREAIRTFAVEHRNGWARIDDLFPLLGQDGTAVLRPFLFGR